MLPAPTLLGIELSWYWLLILAAGIVSVFGFIYLDKQKPAGGALYQKLGIIYALIIIGFIFGRVFSLIEHFFGPATCPSAADFFTLFKTWPGTRWYGALFSGFIFLEIMRSFFSKTALNWSIFLNHVVIAVSLGLSIGKIGCFLDGHLGCGGLKTDLPWGVHYPHGEAASLAPLHPVQLYDSLAYFSIFLLLFLLRAKGVNNLYLLFFIGVGVYNFFIEYIIANAILLPAGLSFGQYTYIIMGFLSILLFSIRKVKPPIQ